MELLELQTLVTTGQLKDSKTTKNIKKSKNKYMLRLRSSRLRMRTREFVISSISSLSTSSPA